MKVKKSTLIKHLIRCAQFANNYARVKDKENNLDFYLRIEELAELVNEDCVFKRIVICTTICNGFTVICGIYVDGKRIYEITKEMKRLICNENSDNSLRREIINEVSQFLQKMGFDDASKAVDCEFEL